MRIHKYLLPLLFLLTLARVSAQDFTHLTLNVEPEPVNSEVIGTAELDFTLDEQQDSIFLDGIRMRFLDVQLNQAEAKYNSSDTGIYVNTATLTPGDTHHLRIAYRCRPRKGMYFIGWNPDYESPRQQIWTQGQGIDHRHWIPHNDDQRDKLTVDLHIVFDENYQVIANGVLQSRKQVPNTQKVKWHYRVDKPMSSYLIAVVIGEYEMRQTLSRDSVPLRQYYYPDMKDRYATTYHGNERIFNFMRAKIGLPYPWKNYKQVPVQDFRHGAMENTGAVIFGDFFIVDSIAFNDRNYTYVNAHELAHHWFGNYVTATGSEHHWLHEGFATYYQWLSETMLYGEDYGAWQRKKARDIVYSAMAGDTLSLMDEGAGSARYYQKGAWTLHMLKEQLGEAALDSSLRHYLQKYALGLVTTDSLNASICAVTGEDYKGFFERWVATAGNPILKIKSELKDKKLEIEILEGSYLPFGEWELPVEIAMGDGIVFRQTLKLQRGKRKYTLSWKYLESVDYWNINPRDEKLLLLREQRPLKYIENQYNYSWHVLDKLAAVKSAAENPAKEELKWLQTVVEDAKAYHGVRAAALQALLSEDSDKYQDQLLTALQSGDLDLQKSAIFMVSEADAKIRKALRDIRLAPSYELREAVIHRLVNPRDRKENQFLYDSAYVKKPGIPDHGVHITALVYQFVFFRDTAAQNQLVAYATPRYDFNTRIKAMNFLRQVGYFSPKLMKLHFLAVFNENWKLRKAGRQALREAYENEEYRELIDQYREQQKSGWNEKQQKRVDVTFRR